MLAPALETVLDDLPGAQPSYPFGPGTRVYKVGGRIFALCSDRGTSISLKCDPIESEGLRRAFPGITPGYHLNKQHWITVALDGNVPEDLVLELTASSYRLVFNALTRAQRAWVLANPHD
ncbi:MmcQ/YjbR family DNA-binding protein [Salinibacterium sp. ZJ454]|uniref:MmcQ/YjbR family DNA-binding protein n=1 Tax=Salinibacterium sp. ZJ454 TaxID=2708339 RepID=UPI0014205334|nr:MmcQ/YjbR family DNA-binding protein [Salinibacterium sp. ZJ454]